MREDTQTEDRDVSNEASGAVRSIREARDHARYRVTASFEFDLEDPEAFLDVTKVMQWAKASPFIVDVQTEVPKLVPDPPFISPPEGINLSERELSVLTGIAAGLSNKEIGRYAKIKESTVKVHMKNIFKKIRARNRTEAALWAHGNLDNLGSTEHVS